MFDRVLNTPLFKPFLSAFEQYKISSEKVPYLKNLKVLLAKNCTRIYRKFRKTKKNIKTITTKNVIDIFSRLDVNALPS